MIKYARLDACVTSQEVTIAKRQKETGVQTCLEYYASSGHITRKRWQELDLCEVSSMLQRLWESEHAPLDIHRSPEKRLLSNCRDDATLLCAFLRFQQIPARVRYGFATYFEANFYMDHVVCEYWNTQQQRWILVDAQIDEVLRHAYGISLNTLDLPQDAFLPAGRAWQLYRSVKVATTDFGITSSGPCGVAFIRTGVLHELRAVFEQ